MSALERLLASVLLAVVLAVAGWFGIHHYGAVQYDAGYAAALAAGKAQHDHDVIEARRTETDLRDQLAQRDAAANRKEQEYETNLDAAQRRVRAGTDRLRCPASTVQPAAAAGDRPAASGPEPGAEGPGIVPEVAADLLGVAADVAGLVRRYGRLEQRFEDCRTVNAR